VVPTSGTYLIEFRPVSKGTRWDHGAEVGVAAGEVS
jgi:hypothetical protein